ncbi:MAG TPA: DUF5946 family protein [Anaerolineaceae bacterium]|jgi:hypothetical protein
MADICPECGAVLTDHASCQEVFDAFLVLEFSDPGYGEVHMLTVACFMIQHGRYSDTALTWIEQQLRANLEGGIPPAQILRQAAAATNPAKRTWKVTRQPCEPPLPKIAWSVTIADGADQYQDAGSYCAWVRRWARTTLQEMKPLVPPS